MLRRNHGRSHEELWRIASRVIGQCGPRFLLTDEFGTEVTDEDIRIATDSGFVEWDIDCDGINAGPTEEYNFWDGRAEANEWPASE